MLNGVAPIFIFTVSPVPKTSNPLSGVPVISDLLESVGIPIPIYLDEQLTGLYVDTEEKSIDIDNDVVAVNKGGAKVFQNPLESMVTINLIGKKDSVALMVLLAMNDLIFSKLKYGYGISYLNGPTAIFNGLLKTFATNSSSENDLIRITMQISKAKGSKTEGALSADKGAIGIDAVQGTVDSGVAAPVGSGGGTILAPPAQAPIPIGGAGA